MIDGAIHRAAMMVVDDNRRVREAVAALLGRGA